MGLGNWLRKTFGGDKPSHEMVPFLDTKAGRVIHIPASELPPEAIQVRLQPTGETVWALPEHLRQGEVKHPPFDEGIREHIRQIRAAFAEHRPLSFEEWEDGFRRDANPAQEIAVWLHAANVYTAFAGKEPAADRRKDVYRCVVACMTTGPEAIGQVLRPEVLSRAEAEQVVHRFFGKQAGPSAEPDRGGTQAPAVKTYRARSVQYEPAGDTLRVFVEGFASAASSMVDADLYLDAGGSLVAVALAGDPDPIVVVLGPREAVTRSVPARVLRMEQGALLITMGAKRVRGDVRNPYVPWAVYPDSPK